MQKNAACATRAQRPRQEDRLPPPSAGENIFDSSKHCLDCDNPQHVALHPRFSGHHDELDEQSWSNHKMGAFEWLLNKLHKVEFDKNSWHSQLHIVQRCHHRMITFNTFVHNLLTEVRSLDVSVQNVTHTLFKKRIASTYARLLSSEAKNGNPEW